MSRPVFLSLLLIALGACDDDGAGSEADTGATVVKITSIAAVQGNADASPLVDQAVTVIGVVSGDFQNDDADDSRNLGGFFLQSITPDDDPETSDGVFIFDGDDPAVDVVAGQLVQVTGTVNEWFSETQIIPETIAITGEGEASPVELTLPVNTSLNSDDIRIPDLERFEGMLVRLSEPAYVTENYNLGRYGELTLAASNRLFQFTNVNAPDVAGYAAHVEQIAGNTIILDDGLASQNPETYRYLEFGGSESEPTPLRIGDSIVATGNIRFSRGSGNFGTETYRLVPTIDPEFSSTNPRSEAPPQTGGAITVASFNVLNYFTTIDSGQEICGPAGGMNCRGANSEAELRRQHAKTINTLLALDADIVGLMELENNGGDSLQSIVNGLNDDAGTGEWGFISTGHIGTDAITVGIIYKTDRVAPAGDFSVLTSSVDSRFNDRKNRPALAQTFDAFGGGRFTVAVNHLKSKGSNCDDVGDPNRNDGQGNCNQTRTRAAAALGDWLSADPTNSGDPDILIIGDLNSYLREDPLVALENAGFVNLLDSSVGSAAYSYVFGAQAGALDHAFASRSLASRVSGVAEWHINADEPPLIDYNLDFDRDADLFDETTPFRASDHDPVIVGINP